MPNYNLPNSTPQYVQNGELINESITNRPMIDIQENVEKTKDILEQVWNTVKAILNTADAYDSSTTYEKDIIVKDTGSNDYYISLTSNNQGNSLSDNTKWRKLEVQSSEIIQGSGAPSGNSNNYKIGQLYQDTNTNYVYMLVDPAGTWFKISTAEGSGSGLDADTVDGLHASQFIRSDTNDTATGQILFSNATNSSSTTSGAVKISGGVGVAKNLHVGGTATFHGNAVVQGNLTVQGTTTTIDTTTLQVEDKNIEIGKVSSPSDSTADGGGITLLGSTNKTIAWHNSDDRWHFNQGIQIDGPTSGTFDAIVLNNSNIVGVNQLKISDPGEGVVWEGGANGDKSLILIDDSNDSVFNFVGASELRVDNHKVWTDVNDGSGSGLDADKVDGLHASQFIRSDANDYYSGTLSYNQNSGFPLKFDADANYVKFISINDGQGNFNFSQNWAGNNTHIENGGAARITMNAENGDGEIQLRVSPNKSAGNGVTETNLIVKPNNVTINGNKIWHAGNDGSGSGLDADRVDGLQASQFLRSDINDIANGLITFTNSDGISTSQVNTYGGQQLVLNAGESKDKVSGQTNEYVYVNAEQGLSINTPDSAHSNWGTGYSVEQAIIKGSSFKFGVGKENVIEGFSNEIRLWAKKATNDTTTRYLSVNIADNATLGDINLKDKDDAIKSRLVLKEGAVQVVNTTQATSVDTGAFQVDGGVGINKDLWVGGTIHGNINGNVNGTASNADKLDGLDSSQFLRSDTADTANGQITYTPKWLKLTNTEASIAFDDANAPDGYGFKRITCNDGGGNWNFRAGAYFDGSDKYATTGNGATRIVQNFEGVDGSVTISVAKKNTGNAGDGLTWDNGILLNKDLLLTNKDLVVGGGVDVKSNMLKIRRDSSSAQYIQIDQDRSVSTAPTITSYSATSNAKTLIVESTTDTSDTAPTSGTLGVDIKVRGISAIETRESVVNLKHNTNVYGDLNFQNNALIASNGGSSNIDHIWHKDGDNSWNFVSDGAYKSTGNSRLKAGSIELNGSNRGDGDGYSIYSNSTKAVKDGHQSAIYVRANYNDNNLPSADRAVRGAWIGVYDSSTGNDTASKERFARGVEIYSQISGDSTRAFGTQSFADSKKTSGTLIELKGAYNVARDYSRSGVTSTNVYGSMNFAIKAKEGTNTTNDVSTIIGSHNKAYSESTYDKTVQHAKGSYSEVEINGADTVRFNEAMGVQSIIDNNKSTSNVGTGYLFHGSYQGALPQTAWGMYIPTNVGNYFRGKTYIGDLQNKVVEMSTNEIKLWSNRGGSGDTKGYLYLNQFDNGSGGELSLKDENNNTLSSIQLKRDGSITVPSVSKITNTTQSTSVDTGALQVDGGVGVNKDLWVGGTIHGSVSGNVNGTASNADKLDGLDTSSSGNYWGVIPKINSYGVMEVGKYIDFHNNDNDTSDYDVRLQVSGSNSLTIIGSLRVTGTIQEDSDERLKENIDNIDNPLDKLSGLRGVYFNKKSNPENRELGFIAQEVEKVVPELVYTDDNGMKSVAYQRTVALLTEAVKEQQHKLEKQQKEIEELKLLVKTLVEDKRNG